MTMKTTCVKVKDMIELGCSSEERATVHEGGIPLPPHPSCGGLQNDSDEMSLKTWPTPLLRRINKPINRGKEGED